MESAAWSLLVVVAAVDAEHLFEVSAAEDEDPVEAVGAEGADPALGEGVRVRRLNRRPDYADAFGAEDLVEGATELRVAIMDEEAKRLTVSELLVRLRACWLAQRPSEFEVQAMYSIRRVPSEIKKRT